MKKTAYFTESGFTLVELLVALVIMGVVLTGVVQMFTRGGRQHTGQEMLVTTTQDLRAAKMLMVQEIREAGLNSTGVAGIGFQRSGDDRKNTDANSVHFTRDIYKQDSGTWVDGYDGEVNGPDEDIQYYRTNDDCSPGAVGAILAAGNATPGCLRRDTGGGGQAVMPDVTNLQFVYYDASNNVIPPATLTTLSNLETIKSVEVTLAGQVENPAIVDLQARVQTLQFRVLIRNI